MRAQTDLHAAVAHALEIVQHAVDLSFLPVAIRARAVMVDAHRSGGGEDADVLKDVVHLRGGLGDPMQLAAVLAAKELDPVEDAVIVAAGLHGIDARSLALAKDVDHLLGGVIVGHFAAHRLRVVRVAAKWVAADDQAGDLVATEGDGGQSVHQ